MDLRRRAKDHASAIKNNNHSIEEIAEDSKNNNIFTFEALEIFNTNERTERTFQNLRIKEYSEMKSRLEAGEQLYNREELWRIETCLHNAKRYLTATWYPVNLDSPKYIYKEGKDKYTKYSVMLLNGTKEQIQELGFNFNKYVNDLIQKDLKKRKQKKNKQ
jgi:hypothetical protein